jgi:putative ABC transport system substrate-binding protein
LDRRTFLGTLTGGLLAAPLAVEAQQPGKVWRVAYLSLGPGELHTPRMKALTQQLRELGYVEGKNLILDYQSAEGQPARLADLAAALVVTKPDAIIAGGGTLTARAAKKATDSIPIVMVAVGDPVAAGLVASLARPGGNVTGLSTLAPEVAEKRIQLLAELLPRLSHVAVLLNPVTPYSERALAEIKTTATSLGVQVHVVEMRSASDLAAALKQAMRFSPALIVLEDPLTYALREKIAELAIANQLTAIYGFREHVEVGGLMSYGADLTALYRRAASYLDKILKGVRPADLPVEQPTTFELVINLKTAKSLGLTIPPSLLQRADQVIE